MRCISTSFTCVLLASPSWAQTQTPPRQSSAMVVVTPRALLSARDEHRCEIRVDLLAGLKARRRTLRNNPVLPARLPHEVLFVPKGAWSSSWSLAEGFRWHTPDASGNRFLVR